MIAHLVSKDGDGNTSHPITHDHCDKAKAILERVGISHKLWWNSVPYEKATREASGGHVYVGELRYGRNIAEASLF
jgi:hypothetical protein